MTEAVFTEVGKPQPDPGAPWSFRKWLRVISPIILLAIGLVAVGYYFQGKLEGVINSDFPELNIVYAALQKNYPDQNNIGVNVQEFYGNDGTQSRVVTLSLINSASTTDQDMQAMGRIVCAALENASITTDIVTIRPVKEINIALFHGSYANNDMSGNCDWWMGTSTGQ